MRKRRVRNLGVITLVFAPFANCQSTSDELPSFEVATIKPVKSGPLPANWRDAPTGRKNEFYLLPDVSLQVSLQIAYHLPPYRIEGPAWIGSQRFDIVAKMPATTPDDEVLKMFQRLLTERFQLKFHWEDRSVKAYALVVDKKGPKLKAAEGSEPLVGISRFRLNAKCKSMDDLANILMRWTDRPVIDRTGLTGNYDFTLDWRPADGSAGASSSALDVLPDLGLKVVAQTISLRYLVIDSANREPTEN